MANVIVERSFVTPVTNQELEAVGQRLAKCLEQYRVTWVRSFLSPDRRRMICQYEASDAESVRIVQNTADAHYDRVWVADVLGGV
ncbi:MAG TPA: nickel-binding protein [Burkholderiaceae bacterium]|nr:nickel-binding protein [Burkholderiaceae bacterium]